MFGGGEEYFAPPEEVDVDTLKRFSAFCAKLRLLTEPKGTIIASLSSEANEVGTSMIAKEIVAGAILRHIKTWSGKKQLAFWYLLDKLSKLHKDTFGFYFGNHILDVGTDHIPWEDAGLSKKYSQLIDTWDKVFPPDVVQAIYSSKKQRLFFWENPEEKFKEEAAEEEIWMKEERNHQEADGLDLYEQPCLAFLQGNCQWGSECTLLHPEGLEGSLPPECRLGDWKCPGCGSINRHFRRRCLSCPREKPQYRKNSSATTAEEKLLSTPDVKIKEVFRKQFGYDPGDSAEGVAHWTKIFSTQRTTDYLESRRRKFPKTRFETTPESLDSLRTKKHRSENASGKNVVHAKLPTIPPLGARERIFYLAGCIIERGVHDKDFAGHLFLLCKALPELSATRGMPSSAIAPESSLLLLECTKLVYTSWTSYKNANSDTKKHPGTPFFRDIAKYLALIPVDTKTRDAVKEMCNVVNSSES